MRNCYLTSTFQIRLMIYGQTKLVVVQAAVPGLVVVSLAIPVESTQ